MTFEARRKEHLKREQIDGKKKKKRERTDDSIGFLEDIILMRFLGQKLFCVIL